jgi:hypothetical protein
MPSLRDIRYQLNNLSQIFFQSLDQLRKLKLPRARNDLQSAPHAV